MFQGSKQQWQIVFYINAVLMVASGVFFMVFGSGLLIEIVQECRHNESLQFLKLDCLFILHNYSVNLQKLMYFAAEIQPWAVLLKPSSGSRKKASIKAIMAKQESIDAWFDDAPVSADRPKQQVTTRM